MKKYVILRRVSETAKFGGCERMQLDWLGAVNYEKCSVDMVVTKNARHIFEDKIKNLNLPFNIIELPFDMSGPFLRRFKEMFFFLFKLKPNSVVFIQGHFSDFSLAEVLAAFIITFGQVYMTEHSEAFLPEERKQGIISKYSFRKRGLSFTLRAILSKKILAVSDAVRQTLIKHWAYPKYKVTAVYHGVDSRLFAPSTETYLQLRNEYAIPQSVNIIISTARLSKEKRIDRLIYAFEMLYQIEKNNELFIIGGGVLEKELKTLSQKLTSYKNIKFIDHVNDVSSYLKMSDIYVLSSDHEGFSIALLEAMSTGLISVTTNISGASEIIINGINGFIVEKEVASIFQTLKEAVNLPTEKKRELRNNARKTILDNFDIRKRSEEAISFLGLSPKYY